MSEVLDDNIAITLEGAVIEGVHDEAVYWQARLDMRSELNALSVPDLLSFAEHIRHDEDLSSLGLPNCLFTSSAQMRAATKLGDHETAKQYENAGWQIADISNDELMKSEPDYDYRAVDYELPAHLFATLRALATYVTLTNYMRQSEKSIEAHLQILSPAELSDDAQWLSSAPDPREYILDRVKMTVITQFMTARHNHYPDEAEWLQIIDDIDPGFSQLFQIKN